jgi:hypothetical protein
MLRDEKDWDPKTMIDITETYGRMNPSLKESLQSMKPKENSDQRKSRLRREAKKAKQAKEAKANTTPKLAAKAKPSKAKKKSSRVAAKKVSNTERGRPDTSVHGFVICLWGVKTRYASESFRIIFRHQQLPPRF